MAAGSEWNLVELIRARAVPEAQALVQGGRHLTYAELLQRVDAMASALREITCSAQSLRVGVHVPSGLDYIPLAMAVLASGHCFVPVPEELSDAEKAELVRRTALEVVLVAKASEPWLPGETTWNETLGVHVATLAVTSPAFPEEAFRALRPAFIRFSSGTTGTSKGVVLSHASLKARIEAANSGLRIGAGDRVLWVLPMAHHFAVSIVLYLYFGATTVIAEQHLAEDLLRTGEQEGITVMYGSPMHYRALAGCPVQAQWPQLRLVVSTAAALDVATAEGFAQRFGQPLRQGYGIIECGLPLLNFSADPEAIGTPLAGYEARLRYAGQDGIGELCVRGAGLFDAYLDPWQPRAQVVDAEGWFASGDLAECSESGVFKLRGRRKSVINVGGMKVFPEEVERVLDEHPGVARSLVSGRAHSLTGEVPVAKFVPQGEAPSAVILRSYCRTRLAGYKVPVMFEAVESLPLTASGKLRRSGGES